MRDQFEPGEEQQVILTSILTQLTQERPITFGREQAPDFARGLLQALDCLGWSLAYDPTKTADNIKRIVHEAR